MYGLRYLILIITVILFSSCRTHENPADQKSLEFPESENDTISIRFDTQFVNSADALLIDTIYGDTVWMHPYGSQGWRDTLISKNYTVFMKVWVDTNDYLIDTVRSKKGNRIVIGYNHFYRMDFRKNNKEWFSLEFNKRKELASLLQGTEFWMDSNLDVFQNLVYNEKYKKFIIEFDINPRYNYGSVFYLVFNTKGEIDYIGTSNSWGGGGADGTSFLTQNMESFIGCYEVYNFRDNSSLSIAEYAMLAENKESGNTASLYKQLHALRRLAGNHFLLVFNTNRGEPEYNGLVLATDTTLLYRFKYYGFMEEMDAMLLFVDKPSIGKCFLYDTEREVLICINETDSITLTEFPISDLRTLPKDSNSAQFTVLDFEAFGSYRFFIDSSVTHIYQASEITE